MEKNKHIDILIKIITDNLNINTKKEKNLEYIKILANSVISEFDNPELLKEFGKIDEIINSESEVYLKINSMFMHISLIINVLKKHTDNIISNPDNINEHIVYFNSISKKDMFDILPFIDDNITIKNNKIRLLINSKSFTHILDIFHTVDWSDEEDNFDEKEFDDEKENN